MKVRIIANIRNEEGAFDPCYHYNENQLCECAVKEVREEIARDWIEKGWAVRVIAPATAPIETAAFEGSPETTVGRRQRRQ